MNRVLTEGRRALRRNAMAIEAGDECERLAPVLTQLAVRAGGVDDPRELRDHLRTCLSCRARLKSLRTTGGEARRRPETAASEGARRRVRAA